MTKIFEGSRVALHFNVSRIRTILYGGSFYHSPYKNRWRLSQLEKLQDSARESLTPSECHELGIE